MLFVMEQFRPELNTVETLTADGKLFFSTELLGKFVATIRAFEVSDWNSSVLDSWRLYI